MAHRVVAHTSLGPWATRLLTVLRPYRRIDSDPNLRRTDRRFGRHASAIPHHPWLRHLPRQAPAESTLGRAAHRPRRLAALRQRHLAAKTQEGDARVSLPLTPTGFASP